MVTKSTPIGQDRHFISYYAFPYDPTLILVEDKQNPNIFSLITCRSKLNALLASLDTRGIRENNLSEKLSSNRKYLHNDVKSEQELLRKKRKEKEKDELVEKLKLLENESNNENIRRSSRATQTEMDRIQRQIEGIDKSIEDYKNEGTKTFLKLSTFSFDDNITNHIEMASFFINELIELESAWSDDLCMSFTNESFDRRKWKANLNNKRIIKNHDNFLHTLKESLLNLEEYINKSTNVDVYFKGYSTLENNESGPKPWEQKIKQLRSLPGQSYKKGKALLEDAMSLSTDPVVKEGLQEALGLITNRSLNAAKSAASDILQKHGTAAKEVVGKDDDTSSTTSNDMQEENTTDEHFLTEEASIMVLQRCAALSLHLSSAAEDDEGKDDALNPLVIQDERSDWISFVKSSCTNFSMLAIVLLSFKKDVLDLIGLLSDKQDLLLDAIKNSKSRKKKIKLDFDSSVKLWTPVNITNDFMWIQWRQPFRQMISIPARMCEPLNSDVSKLFERLNMHMYAPVGEDLNYYCISKDDCLMFHPSKHDDKVKLNEGCEYWVQCMAIATTLYDTERTS